ncbi:hypothetical protein FX988_03845 [Paraglaciecola mesophila]|uniref:Capsule biosynthesis protein n=1 Tax=Paraglaciecola mesophila TaxID=197222 RepID=A0A857JNC6_9ALTE|nr:capsule biosynthesis protein [Paraglaciecola mesophila]QHJ13579.1 hypothetical protein FX988_03845 [Paraglaciecola mesophila]
MLASEAIAANQKRVIRKISELDMQNYCLVGDGAYAKDLLAQLSKLNISLPTIWWVSCIQTDYPHIEQHIEDPQSRIELPIVVLGTGHFQIEMIHRLAAKTEVDAEFWDMMLCAPEHASQADLRTSNNTLLYIDLYASINRPAYLQHFFSALEDSGTHVNIHHPLQNLSDSYLQSAKSVVVWNGSTSAFLPIIEKLKALKIAITFAECGFFPQHQYFYFDRLGVNNNSQLYFDDLSWVNEQMLQNLKQLRQQFLSASQDGVNTQRRYIFIPLQVPSDSNVLNHSKFTNGMQPFIDFIEAQYPQQNLVFKPHPKDRLSHTYRYYRGKVSSKDTIQLCAHADIVHGINSSVLYEAALLGKKVVVEGDCLLKKHISQVDRLLAAMCYRQFSVTDTYFDLGKLQAFSFISPSLLSKNNKKQGSVSEQNDDVQQQEKVE